MQKVDIPANEISAVTTINIDHNNFYWLGQRRDTYYIICGSSVIEVGTELENAQRLFLAGLNRTLRKRWGR